MPSKSAIIGSNDQASAMYDFIPTTTLKGVPEEFIDESDFYQRYESVNDDGAPVDIVPEKHLMFPNHLEAYGNLFSSLVWHFCNEYILLLVFPPSLLNRFPPPGRCVHKNTSILEYNCIDLALLLPVIALNLRPGERVLDLCSGATDGEIAMAAMQTLLPSQVLCNEHSKDKLKKITEFAKSLLDGTDFEKYARFHKQNPMELPILFTDAFDKVICHVPSTADRRAVHLDEANFFNSHNKKERLELPETQINLLA